MTFCGDLPLFPPVFTITFLRTFAAWGITATDGNDCPGQTAKFCLLLGKNFCGMSFHPGLAETVVAVLPRRQGLKQVNGTGQNNGQGTRRNDVKRGLQTALPLTSRRSFAGMPERRPRRDRGGATGTVAASRVFTHRTVATARNRASGFGGDWQVRQQLPVGVGPDDRMPPGSREPKVRVRQEVA